MSLFGIEMPIEALGLTVQEVPLLKCPACQAQPFTPFMRGQVQRKWWKCWAGIRSMLAGEPRDFNYCAVICADCKQLVDWERPYDLAALMARYESRKEAKAMIREYWKRGTD